MAEQMRDIKRRIRSIKNTEQITRAMEMVAAARLRRAQARVEAARPYAEEILKMAGRLVSSYRVQVRRSLGGFFGSYNASYSDLSHPLLEKRLVKTPGFVVFTSDRGLCGAFNAHVIRFAEENMKESGSKSLMVIGRKGRDYFRRRGYDLLASFTAVGDEPGVDQARAVVRNILELYLQGALDEVRLVYSQFISTSRQQPVMQSLLPIEVPDTDEEKGYHDDYIYEPDPERVLDMILPRFIEAQVYRAMLEAKASEHAARMLAMGNATENAGEMISQLTLSFNKARQAAITKELTEIVTGAEALKG